MVKSGTTGYNITTGFYLVRFIDHMTSGCWIVQTCVILIKYIWRTISAVSAL